jgi:hypothetical protein
MGRIVTPVPFPVHKPGGELPGHGERRRRLILYLVSKGADTTEVARKGQTTADVANGPVQRIQPFPETVELPTKLGSKSNHRCMSC